ncbi:MAG: inorganic pyrophosphatase [Candidatus Melainabacteria bacterium]|jgi:inorganic pyrophosphatase|nr:inorganic pyrophosphatase [Candidatus Melainabacteria bacterium]
MSTKPSEFKKLLATLFKSHPWHGVSPGENAPQVVSSYIEIVPTGAVKLELHKHTGHLHVDRPQRFSSMCPTLYGFVPQTYCGDRIGDFAAKKTRRSKIKGDGDPLDICVLTEKDFAHGDLFVTVRPIGGLRMIDHGEADDKIVAVLENDIAYGHIQDISQVPAGVIERLEHYFLSYKRPPMNKGEKPVVDIAAVYGRKEAHEVIRLSMADYEQAYGTEESRLEQLRQLLSVALPPAANGANGNGKMKSKSKSKAKTSATKSKATKSGFPRRNPGR